MFGKIIGTGSYIPERKITNNELTELVETNDEWIRERTGIGARHVMTEENTAEMAHRAAKRAVQNANIDVSQIDLIIVSSVSSNLILPNTACYVQDKLGAVNAMCFDLNTACTGFMVAYNTAQTYINAGLINTALIIAAEGLSKLVDWTDRETCILFGDGAGAAVITKDEDAVFDTVMHADGSEGNSLFMENDFATRTVPFVKNTDKAKADQANEANKAVDTDETGGANYISMNGRDVFMFAVDKVPKCIKELLGKIEKTVDDIDWFVLHQANERIISSITKRIKADSAKVPVNIAEYGNTSSACIPILLDEMMREGKLKKGDKIIMSGFGAGLTWSATYLEL
ncbi:MAG: ketoacyl-ACP synthase III [Lachnospiraceae bacterium]|nr:ketoacyl-ACP synthase III [Lachnospiraceae bacterium]